MSRKDRTASRRQRRSVLGVGTAAGAAFAAALISMGTAATASAIVADADPDPFQDLFGNTDFNSWTVAADEDLAAFNSTLADQFDSSVDSFRAVDANPFSELLFHFDSTAFDANPDLGGLPITANGDFAVATDYLLSFSGLGAQLDPIVDLFVGPDVTAAAALAEEPDLDGFQDLFGTSGINTWTTMADNTLAALSPALADFLDKHVDAFLALPDADPFTDLVQAFDSTAFDGNTPLTAMADCAVGMDYLLSFTGAGATLDPIIDNLLGMMPAV